MAQQVDAMPIRDHRRRSECAPRAAARRPRSRRPGSAPTRSSSCSSRRCTAAKPTGLDARRPHAAAVHACSSRSIERLRAERLIEVRGAAGIGHGGLPLRADRCSAATARGSTSTSTSTSGRRRCRWPPTSTRCGRWRRSRGYIDRERLRSGFSHLIVSDHVLEQLGPAVNAGKAMFLYGPPGNGKTVIAEGMGRTLGGDMYVPHAIDVDGHIDHDVRSRSTTSRSKPRPTSRRASSRSAPRDRRWVRIRRPVVMVGGELTLDMLDLTFNPISKFYEAPIQLKANGGVFLVDDFGRQRMRPEELLNRWIVPLESRVDYLTLHTGKKFQVPFDVLIVFATNLDPASLADEAFLRRIPYKIPIDDPTHRGVHAHLRAELPAAQPAVPSGDGRVPAAPALRARRPAAARLPSARSARSGHRALPLSRHRAGRSRASCSTRPARRTSSTQAPTSRRRRRSRARTTTTAGGALMRLRMPATAYADLAGARAASSARCSRCCRSTCSATSCAPAASPACCCWSAKSLVVVLTVLRRRAQHRRSLGGGRGHDHRVAGRAAAAARDRDAARSRPTCSRRWSRRSVCCW